MKTSETITKIIPALLEAQKKIESVNKDSENPFFKSKYADINSLIDACKKILNDNGIIVLQPTTLEGVETTLIHISGEYLTSITKIVCKSDNNPQDQGSAITYSRRYGLQSMLFMTAEDDDGEKATEHKQVKTIIRNENDPQEGDTLEVICEQCGSKMDFVKSGTKQSGADWHMYKCSKDGSHKARFL